MPVGLEGLQGSQQYELGTELESRVHTTGTTCVRRGTRHTPKSFTWIPLHRHTKSVGEVFRLPVHNGPDPFVDGFLQGGCSLGSFKAHPVSTAGVSLRRRSRAQPHHNLQSPHSCSVLTLQGTRLFSANKTKCHAKHLGRHSMAP